ncbi:phenylacetate--CoA ligase family protein [Micromonospora sp. WMMD734]|uniref:phenylacetate--CoA ligase family protein n=1 Tax=Micromonospora sp. WMMD734 TaxID=3404129 RepID=UPI003B931E90
MSNFHRRSAAACAAAERERQTLAAAGFKPDVVTRIQGEKLAQLWERLDGSPRYRDLPHVRARDFAGAPVTEKQEVKADPFGFVRDDGSHVRYYETSGSTGSPTPTPRAVEDVVWNTASVATVWSRTLRPGDRVASLLPSDVVPVGDLVASVAEHLDCMLLRCYPFAQGMCDWDRLEELFSRFRPDHVFVAPGVMLQWTRLLKQRGRLDAVRESLRTALLLGEVSTAPMRARLAALWDCRVIDASYGSTETGTIGAGCEHDRMHLLLPAHIAELRGEDGAIRPARPGDTGELVTTTLNNHTRPLLRYATGDIGGVLPGDGCPCGLGLPVLTIHGRASDAVSVAGRPISVENVESVVYAVPEVTGYLIQLRGGDQPAARLVLERDVDFTGPPEPVAGRIRARFAELGVTWNSVVLVNQLPALTKAGASQKNWKRTNVEWLD